MTNIHAQLHTTYFNQNVKAFVHVRSCPFTLATLLGFSSDGCGRVDELMMFRRGYSDEGIYTLRTFIVYQVSHSLVSGFPNIGERRPYPRRRESLTIY
jgi:hypothetical protein